MSGSEGAGRKHAEMIGRFLWRAFLVFLLMISPPFYDLKRKTVLDLQWTFRGMS